ncbi:hypothetical protein OPKNFCMD_4326 [Methylobacterium crusticola]|uniref:Uncharacterized protein n=1 Tax=Methylobacterium crusticola TaxID=1697972 RepID=A0ABQ4R1Q1_9HYPH|nr:hypothetical protein [Methylobacterium crusticola]GJD51571.1 hypothetical protein OPKNFCMD_4326 [Methylobacterium crusticola]
MPIWVNTIHIIRIAPLNGTARLLLTSTDKNGESQFVHVRETVEQVMALIKASDETLVEPGP